MADAPSTTPLHEVLLTGGPLDGHWRYALEREDVLLVMDVRQPPLPGAKLYRYRRVDRAHFTYEREQY